MWCAVLTERGEQVGDTLGACIAKAQKRRFFKYLSASGASSSDPTNRRRSSTAQTNCWACASWGGLNQTLVQSQDA